jgi:hypothetical protein
MRYMRSQRSWMHSIATRVRKLLVCTYRIALLPDQWRQNRGSWWIYDGKQPALESIILRWEGIWSNYCNAKLGRAAQFQVVIQDVTGAVRGGFSKAARYVPCWPGSDAQASNVFNHSIQHIARGQTPVLAESHGL